MSASPTHSHFLFIFLSIDTNTSQGELPNQLWLSCCSPRDLIHNHNQYLHGPADGITGNRRVVMDRNMLPQDETKAGFRVFKPKDLLERFLATLKDEIKEAAQSNQPVLVLIFAHGEEDTSQIFLGCHEGETLELSRARFASVLKSEFQTTMVLTSCFSGGWTMAPNCNKHFGVKPTFNHSFLTAAGSQNESIS